MSAALMRQTNGLGRVAAPSRTPRLNVVAKAASKSKSKTKAEPMVCLDCGYVYDGKKGAFDDLPKNYRCPVCNAGKNRFKTAEAAEAGDSSALIGAAVSSAVFLGAVYYFAVYAR